ncbi:hypothetical protein [Pseudonocardia humida]|uniref:Uncharacterized protein n=1 Tax=Pseudonocardia humida TaxID=2800819 RepID=A0ABT1AAQ6_9PSEU|nr:hypothetical protein [Pseudonocardia humida]MCO1660114.1 hypothetical protein [Pseudonocardia humida]
MADGTPAGAGVAGPEAEAEPDPQVTVVLRVDRDGSPARSLPLLGHWRRTAEGPLQFTVDGDLLDGQVHLPTAGSILVWPRKAFGGIVGLHRISLDVSVGPTRIRVDGAVGPPPYWRGIALPGTADTARRSHDVLVSVDVLHLLGMWLDLNAAPTEG